MSRTVSTAHVPLAEKHNDNSTKRKKTAIELGGQNVHDTDRWLNIYI